jgi:hypothetical protein
MKQFNKSIDFSGNLTSKCAFARVDTNPQNNPPAYECHGYTCYTEGQKCLAGRPGSLEVNWTCKNGEWVRD